MLDIKTKEFQKRIVRDYNEYGERAKLAERNGGVDWKACSHAFRAIYQLEELYQTGNIRFPLKHRKLLTSIKKGKYSWATVEQMIIRGVESIEQLGPSSALKNYQWDQEFVDQFILGLYGWRRWISPIFGARYV